MGTLGTRTRNGKKPKASHPALAELAAAQKELKAALEQQAATAEILRALSRSSTDPQPVFEAIVEHAHRLCGAVFSILYRYDGRVMTVVADRGVNSKASRIVRGLYPAPPRRDHIVGRCILDGRIVHSADVPNDPRFPANRNAFMKLVPYRAGVEIPLLRNGKVVGAIAVGRLEPKPFAKKEIALLKTFADQAVIAMENVRLFNETKEALEHQKASADILRIVAGSVEDTDPVFKAITEAGMRLVPGSRVALFLQRDGQLHYASHSGISEALRAELSKLWPAPLDRKIVAAATILDKRVIHIADMLAEGIQYPRSLEIARASGYRGLLCVPLVRGRKAIGCISIARAEPGLFAQTQVALVQTFADQAVIAIENARLFNETKEALEQQTATAEILKVISSSPTSIQPVLDAVAANSARLCEAADAVVALRHADEFHFAAHYGPIPISGTRRLSRDSAAGRSMLEGRQIHVRDLQAETAEFPEGSARSREFGYRAMLATPLMRDGAAIGTILVRRTEARLFSGTHLALVKTFADQAVIAIENVRLFNETKEALERQTASADILRVISSTPTDTRPVFDAIVQSAQRLVSGKSAVLLLRRETDFFVAAYSIPGLDSLPPEVRTAPLDRDKNYPSRVMLDREIVHVPDWEADDVIEFEKIVGKAYGIGSGVEVPLLRKGEGIGALAVTRQTKGPFSEKEIALLQSFADQAVIAIENVRLFNETKEALEQQTATGEILRVMSSSPSDVQPVFETIARNTSRLCNGNYAIVTRYDGELVHLAAEHNARPGASTPTAEHYPRRPSRDLPAARAVLERDVVHIPYAAQDHDLMGEVVQRIGAQSFLAVPMLRDGWPIGAIGVSRAQAGPFPAKQIELVKLFADQAVIAIENVRLFNETKEALEQQTAISEVLRVISDSPTDVKPVLDAVAVRAAKICEASDARIWLVEGDSVRHVAGFGDVPMPVGLGEALPLDRGTVSGRAILDCAPVHVEDMAKLTREDYPISREMQERSGFRTILSVPLMREQRSLGAIMLRRLEVRSFTDKQIALLRTFADQAAIAIENVRLFNETKESLERQTATGEILRVIAGTPADAQPVFDAIAQSALRLFGVAHVVITVREGDSIRSKATAGRADPRGEFIIPLDRDSMAGRCMLDRTVVNIGDTEAPDAPGFARESGRIVGFRAVAAAPMLRDGMAIGSVHMMRKTAGAFADTQIELLKTFADQAVIAIENSRLFNETKEALEQQTAISEVLRVISDSPTDVKPVLAAVALRAARICDATDARIFLVEGEHFRHAAGFGDVPITTDIVPLNRGSPSGRAIVDRAALHVEDMAAASEEDFPVGRPLAMRAGWRSVLSVPLMREDRALGAITLRRMEVRPFTEKQIGLLKTFADQAAIAIENVRLFNETKEALERQTATAEILRVISASPTDVQPVFDAIVQAADRLCDGRLSTVLRFDGESLDLVAHHNLSTEGLEAYRQVYPQRVSRNTMAGRALLDRKVINITDSQDDPDIPPQSRAMAVASGFRSVLVVPMLREGEPIGVLNIARAERGSFSQAQVELLKTFADQAVIAIENVRLFNETKEALEQQTAISEILRVISDSPADVQPVVDAVAARAGRICDASDARIFLVEGETLRHAAGFGDVPMIVPLGDAMPLNRGSAMGRAVIDRAPVHVDDMQNQSADEYPQGRKVAEQAGWHTVLAVPLLREGRSLGAMVLRRMEVRSFSDKQIALLKTFADQAAIAIENVRLFNETKEALERQTATAEILKVISDSPIDVQPVFEAILARAAALCNASFGNVFRYDGAMLEMVACNLPAASIEILRKDYPSAPSRGKVSGRVVLDRQVMEIPDVLDEPEYQGTAPKAGGHRSLLGVPLLREGQAIGAIVIARHEPGRFTPRQVAMVQTFADQAVIAIENVRLFKELQARTEALSKSVGQLTALGDVGRAITSTLDLETVLKTIVQRAVQLTGLDGGSIYEYNEATEQFTLQAAEHMEQELVEAVRRTPVRKGEGAIGRSAVSLEPVQVPDILDESYRSGRKEVLVRAGYRAVLAVPLLREEHMLGAILVHRRTPGPFAPEVVELLKTFATQSAMAIQNARLFREIAEKGKQLEVASQHKSQFLASMSHELRTPLNALLGFNEMLLGDVYGEVPGEMQPPLAQMQSSGKHLLRLINNVLDLAKIEAGRMELALADYSVQDTVESVRSTLQPLAADKGLEFVAAVPADIPLAYGDPGRITQCLMNLAGNSLKFTKAGKVEISVTMSDGQLRYCVADTGIGIPSDKIDGLFTEFKQTDATVASEYGGTGLGLSISKKFVEMHGGRIWAQSEPGRGSVFAFEIPLRAGAT